MVINVDFFQLKRAIIGVRSYEIEMNGEDIQPVVFLYLSRLDGSVIPLETFRMRKYLWIRYGDLDPFELTENMPPEGYGCMR